MILGYQSLIQQAELSLEDGEVLTDDLAALQDTRLSRHTRITFADSAALGAATTLVADWSGSDRTLGDRWIAGLLNTDLPIGTLIRLQMLSDGGVPATVAEQRIRQTETGRSALFMGDAGDFQPVAFVAIGTAFGDAIAVRSFGGAMWESPATVEVSGAFGAHGIAASPTRIVAVGGDGSSQAAVYVYDGETWSEISVGVTSQLLRAVTYLPQTGQFVAVGNSGTIIVSNDGGATWTAQTSGTSAILRGVKVGTDYVVAVGDSGTIRYRSVAGTSWTAGTGGGSASLTDCAEDANLHWVAVGSTGTVLRSDGPTPTDFASESTPVSDQLLGVALSPITGNSNNMVAVGANGVILRWTGTLWSEPTSGTSEPIFGVAHRDGVLVAARTDGILRSDDGGATWSNATVFTGEYVAVTPISGDLVADAPPPTAARFQIVNDVNGAADLTAEQEITVGELELMPAYAAPYGIETGWKETPIDNTTSAASVEEQPHHGEGIPTTEYELTLALAHETHVDGVWRDLRRAIQRGRRVIAVPRGWNPTSQTVDPDLLHKAAVYGYARVVGGFIRTEDWYRWSLTIRGAPGDSET